MMNGPGLTAAVIVQPLFVQMAFIKNLRLCLHGLEALRPD